MADVVASVLPLHERAMSKYDRDAVTPNLSSVDNQMTFVTHLRIRQHGLTHSTIATQITGKGIGAKR
jgi:hypothetical protein